MSTSDFKDKIKKLMPPKPKGPTVRVKGDRGFDPPAKVPNQSLDEQLFELQKWSEQGERQGLVQSFEDAVRNASEIYRKGTEREVKFTRRKLLAYIAKLQKAAR